MKVGDTIRYISDSKFRYVSWPAGIWREPGQTATLIERHAPIPAFDSPEHFTAEIAPGAQIIVWSEYEGEEFEVIA